MARRLLLLLTAALLALLSLTPGAAVADTHNRVGPFLSAVPTHTGGQAAQNPWTHPGSAAESTRNAAGCCVAAKPATSAIAQRGKLRSNLEGLFGPLPSGYEAHHLVAVGDPRAQGARRLLDRFGIDPNSAVNGVALPGRGSGRIAGEAYHPSIHTNPYYDAVEARLAGAQTRREATYALGTIRRDIRAGNFP